MQDTAKLDKLLERNGYSIELNKNRIVIQSVGKVSGKIKAYYALGIFLTVFGIASFLMIGSLWLLLFLTVSIPMFLQARKFKHEQGLLSQRQLVIADDQIIIKQDDGISKINISDIEKIRYRFESSKNLSTAKIFASKSEKEYHLLQIFNDDKRKVDHDAEDIISELNNLFSLV